MSDTDDTDEEDVYSFVAPTEDQLREIHNAVSDRKVEAGDYVKVFFSDDTQVTACVLNVQVDLEDNMETAEIEYESGNTDVCPVHLLVIVQS